MNENYLNAVTYDLIKNNDFTPFKNKNNEYALGKSLKILQKATISEYNVIYLLSADETDASDFREILNFNLELITKLNISGISDYLKLTEVIVFNGKADLQKLKALDEHINSVMAGKIVLETVIVELKQKNVFDYSELTAAENELKIILSNPLYKDLDIYRELPDIDELIDYKPQVEPIKLETLKVPATYSLIGINIIIWLIGQLLLFIYHEDFLSSIGIKDNAAILSGEYWRLITPVFLHSSSDIMHISANSFSLLIFGQYVERIFGTWKFLIIYFIAGLLGNIASFIFSPSLSLGASGAIMGIGGAFVYIWFKNRESFMYNARQSFTFVFLVFFNLFYGFTKPGIDNFAHFGGFIGGYLSAGALNRDHKQSRGFYGAVLFVIIVAGIISGFNK